MDAALLEVVVAVVQAGERLHEVRRLVMSYDNVRLEQAVEARRAVQSTVLAVGPPGVGAALEGGAVVDADVEGLGAEEARDAER